MKRILSVVLALMLILSLFTGCSPKETGPVVICCEAEFNAGNYMEHMIDYLHATGNGTEYVIEELPQNPEARASALTSLRTAIMAGEGPDVFILYADEPNSTDEPLFKNPEKLMSQGLFYDISEYVDNSDIIDVDDCVPQIIEAGTVGESRYILPLYYTYSGTVIKTDALKDPEAVYSDIDEIAASGDTALIQATVYHLLNGFDHYFTKLVDYGTGDLLLNESDLVAAREDFDEFDAVSNSVPNLDNWEEIRLSGYYGVSMFGFQNTGGKDGTVVPLPNKTGGVTASITTYGAINANTSSPNAAFEFLELFLADGVQDSVTGIEVDDTSYAAISMGFAGMHGVPVKTSVYDTAYIGASDATLASHIAATERINAVKFYSELDADIGSVLKMNGGAAPADVISKLHQYMDE